MRINVRNMVCQHCVSALHNMLTQLGYHVTDIGLGYAEINTRSIDKQQIDLIDRGLAALGFARIVDPAAKLIEQVKHEVLNHINSDEPCSHNLSQCISDATHQDYKSVSRLFSAMEGRTIEKYYVTAKIEKAKELLSYGDVTLTEIAYRLGYSSTAFLSRQFKQETGMTPSQYQRSQCDRRPLTEI